MGVDVHWLLQMTPGNEISADTLASRLTKVMLSSPIAKVFTTIDGKLRFISIHSYCRWAPVSPSDLPEARHENIFKELSAMEEIVGDSALIYYADDVGDWPTEYDSAEEALKTLKRYKLANSGFSFTVQLLSLEFQEEEKTHGS